jgi:Ca2+-binding EF-hand superfamily protein
MSQTSSSKKSLALLAVLFAFASSPAWAGEHGPKDEKSRGGHHMMKIDADKDGKVSLDEFITRHKEHFTKLDKNSDAVVDADERKASVDVILAKMKERIEARFTEVDANKDGKITKDESDAFDKKKFTDADKNGDQKLDRKELRETFHRRTGTEPTRPTVN